MVGMYYMVGLTLAVEMIPECTAMALDHSPMAPV
jgi:hypothetical protein